MTSTTTNSNDDDVQMSANQASIARFSSDKHTQRGEATLSDVINSVDTPENQWSDLSFSEPEPDPGDFDA